MAEIDVSKDKNKNNKNKNKNKQTNTPNKPDKTRDIQKLRTPIKIPVFGKMDKFQQGQARLNQAISRFDTAAKKTIRKCYETFFSFIWYITKNKKRS